MTDRDFLHLQALWGEHSIETLLHIVVEPAGNMTSLRAPAEWSARVTVRRPVGPALPSRPGLAAAALAASGTVLDETCPLSYVPDGVAGLLDLCRAGCERSRDGDLWRSYFWSRAQRVPDTLPGWLA